MYYFVEKLLQKRLKEHCIIIVVVVVLLSNAGVVSNELFLCGLLVEKL